MRNALASLNKYRDLRAMLTAEFREPNPASKDVGHSAILVMGDPRLTVQCTILTRSGPKLGLRLPIGIGLPLDVHVVDLVDEAIHEGTVTEHRSRYCGLAISQSFAMSALPARLMALKKVWWNAGMGSACGISPRTL